MALQHSAVSTALVLGRSAWKVARATTRRLGFSADYVRYRGSKLPPREFRFNGPDHADDAYYLRTAEMEAFRVVQKLAYRPDELLVDVGCGQGRLAIGLARAMPKARYLGLDVSRRSIDWCTRHLSKDHPSFGFRYVDVVNARYNPDGHSLSEAFQLPVGDGAAGLVYSWGVVTNMEPEHLAVYAREFARMLRPGGRAYLTANVEDGVPAVTINPENYVSFDYHGPLHIVRYETKFFLDVFETAGLKLDEFGYHANANCQSDLYFTKLGE